MVLCRREPKGKVLSEASSLQSSQAGHHQKVNSSLQHQPVLTPSGGGEVLFVVLCRREPKGEVLFVVLCRREMKGKVLSEVSSLQNEAGHKPKGR